MSRTQTVSCRCRRKKGQVRGKSLELANKQKEVGLPKEMTTAGVEDRGSVDSASKERDPTGCEAVAAELEGQGVNLSPNSKQRKSPGKRTRRKKAQREGEKTIAAAFRSTMIMGQTYKGVVCFLPPGTNRCRIQVEETPLEGFADITALTVTLNQPVKVRMKLQDPVFADAASL